MEDRAPASFDDQNYGGFGGLAGDTERLSTHSTTSGYDASLSASQAKATRSKPQGRVRFNSSAAQQPRPADVERPKPVLTRSPASYNSVTDYTGPEAVSPLKTKSAMEAQLRAQAMAKDAHRKTDTSGTADDMLDCSTTESNEATDVAGDPVDAEQYALPVDEERPPPTDTKSMSEAEELFCAHWNHHATVAADGEKNDGKIRGGIFYQILQAYQNPAPTGWIDDEKKQSTVETFSTPGSSGAVTPRRKWYEQEKETRSQETLAMLVGASRKLANPNEKDSPEPPGAQKRLGHRRITSGRVMSMMRKSKDKEDLIKVHVADILKRQRYIIKMCRALMLCGAPTHRLEEYLSMTAKVLQIECQFLYIPGCMIISFDDVLTHTAEVKIVRTAQGLNLAKLKDTHQIYKEVLHDIIGLDEAIARLEAVQKAKDRWPVWLCIVMYGLASASVGGFFKAGWLDLPVIILLGCILGFLQLYVAPKSSTFSTVFEVTAAALMTFLSRMIGSRAGGDLFCFSALTQSSVAMILPGWLVLCSSLELQSKSMVAGSIRMVYALIYSLFLGYGITVGTALYGAMDSKAVLDADCRNPFSDQWNFLLIPLYIFFVSFTVQAKLKQMPPMVIIALAGFVVNYFSSKKFSGSAPISSSFAAFTIGVMANVWSRLRHGVAAAVLLPAVYVLLPGGLAASGSLRTGLETSSTLVNSANGRESSSATADSMNAIVFDVAASMIQIAIGITVGLLMSTLVIYPLGKRRSGLWTL